MKKILEVGKTYSTKEMIDFFGISQSTWDHSKDKYLENFGKFYEYEIIFGRRNKRQYLIHRVLNEDYRKPESKNSATKRDEIYDAQILDVVEFEPIQSAKNVSRIIKDTEPIIKLNHAEGTVYANTLSRMKVMFGNGRSIALGTQGLVLDKVWCRLLSSENYYVPLTGDEEADLKSLFKAKREECSEIEENIASEYENGEITLEERNALLGESTYSRIMFAKTEFQKRHGFWPIKVNHYGIYDKNNLWRKPNVA